MPRRHRNQTGLALGRTEREARALALWKKPRSTWTSTERQIAKTAVQSYDCSGSILSQSIAHPLAVRGKAGRPRLLTDEQVTASLNSFERARAAIAHKTGLSPQQITDSRVIRHYAKLLEVSVKAVQQHLLFLRRRARRAGTKIERT